VKKSSRRNAVSSKRALGGAAVALCVCACAPHYQAGGLLHGAEACARADSFFAAALPRPLSMRGHATFDVESYRVRGRFELRLSPNGDAVLEFGGSTLLGGHREDAVVSLVDDTLRVLDRERGRYYEGAEVERLVAGNTHADGDWTLGLRRVLAGGCSGIESVRTGEKGLSGSGGDGPFEVQTEGGRISTARWPNPAPEDTFGDHLEVRYHWKDHGLDLIEARLPARGWRVRLEAD
jgi:hypothetical protein